MNYSDEILENKPYNFFKQLMYNLAVAVCIMMLGVLILVYGFKFQLYEVLSDSQAPEFVTGDMVIVRAQKEYNVGDIIKFDTTLPVAHRIIYVTVEGGQKYFICHGDAAQSANPTNSTAAKWTDDAEYVKNWFTTQDGSVAKLTDSSYKDDAKPVNLQIVKENAVDGLVIAHIDNYGAYFSFVKSHWPLFIALVAGIWSITSVVQNEIDIKKCRRLV